MRVRVETPSFEMRIKMCIRDSDKVGGSTLGNLPMAQVSMNCVDIGLSQLAMHSCYETAGARDIVSLIRLMSVSYTHLYYTP